MRIKIQNTNTYVNKFHQLVGISNLLNESEVNAKQIPLQKLIANLRRKDGVQLVPIAAIQKLREFNRRVEPKFGQAESHNKIEELKAGLITQGFTEPLIISYSADNRTAHLTEGNHRLNAAEELGLPYVPVMVLLSNSGSHLRGVTVVGKQPNQYGHVNNVLFPSEIGLVGCLDLQGQAVAPEPDWDDYEDEDSPQAIQPLAHYVDARQPYENANYVEIQYNYDDKFPVWKLFNQLDLDAIYDHDSQHTPRYLDNDWLVGDHYTIDNEESFLPESYRTYLTRLLNTAYVDDMDLFDSLADDPAHKKEWLELKQLLYKNHKLKYNEFAYNSFLNTQYEDMYGGGIEGDFIKGQPCLKYSIAGLKQFKHVHPDTKLLKEVVENEFAMNRYKIELPDYEKQFPKLDIRSVSVHLDKLIH